GHFKRDCKELKTSIEIRRQLKEAKELRERNRTQSFLAPESNFSQDNPYVKVSQEKEQTDKTTDTRDTTLQYISEDEEMTATDAALEITNNEKATTILMI
ncbi:16612_t:CDS:1, partial [Cetraspora pellucida]